VGVGDWLALPIAPDAVVPRGHVGNSRRPRTFAAGPDDQRSILGTIRRLELRPCAMGRRAILGGSILRRV